jgi:hypothetical protein
LFPDPDDRKLQQEQWCWAASTMAMLEHPRLTGALRSSYLLHDTFDLAHHQACRAQVAPSCSSALLHFS